MRQDSALPVGAAFQGMRDMLPAHWSAWVSGISQAGQAPNRPNMAMQLLALCARDTERLCMEMGGNRGRALRHVVEAKFLRHCFCRYKNRSDMRPVNIDFGQEYTR